MVRVRVIADNLVRAHDLAELLAEEERIEVLETAAPPFNAGSHTAFGDVLIAAGIPAPQISSAESNVVFLTDCEPETFEAPGRAWLPLEVSAAELVAAVLAAAEDLTVVTQAQWRRLVPEQRAGQSESGYFVEPLTQRELQVLRMLTDGVGNKEIASRLSLSSHTVKFHVAQILAKLGASSRTEAVTIAIRRGLVPI